MSDPDPDAAAALLRRRAASEPLWIDVRGASMGPRFATTDRVLVAARDRDPRLGEIWVYCVPDAAPIAHRYLRRRADRFQFQGDAHGEPDAPVPRAWLVGQVTHHRAYRRVRQLRRSQAIPAVARAAVSALMRRIRWSWQAHRR